MFARLVLATWFLSVAAPQQDASPQEPSATSEEEGARASEDASKESLDPQVREQAREAFARARELAAQESYAEAIEAFEQALTLRASAGLHYNIAVCHHRLMLSFDKDSPEHEVHRAAAVLAYNAYLDADPKASDRYAVAATIADLGGRPNLLDEWRVDLTEPERASLELRDEDGEAPPADRQADTEPDDDPPIDDPPDGPIQPQTPPPTQPQPPPNNFVRPAFPHGYFGVGIAVDAQAPVHAQRAEEVESLPMLGLVLRGGGYVGQTRQWAVGAELSYAAMTSAARSAHRVAASHLLVLVDWSAKVGPKRRIELGPGLLLGGMVQSLAHAGPSTAVCPLGTKGVISRRTGLSLGTRFNLALLLGKRGQHALTLRAGPSWGQFGDATRGLNCEDPRDAFEQFGMGTSQLILRNDVGYMFRW